MKRQIRIDFCDFWPWLDKHDNFFFKLLSERFEVRIGDLDKTRSAPQLHVKAWNSLT